MARNYKAIINEMIESINKTLGTRYVAQYSPEYGGWEMHTEAKGERDFLSFTARKSNKEMWNYLNGAIMGIVQRTEKNNL